MIKWIKKTFTKTDKAFWGSKIFAVGVFWLALYVLGHCLTCLVYDAVFEGYIRLWTY